MPNAWDAMLARKAKARTSARKGAATRHAAKYGTPCSSTYRTKGGTVHTCHLHAGHKGYHERADRLGFWTA